MNFNTQIEIISRGVDTITSEDLLIEKLQSGKPLNIKAGFDPTAPDLHLGHVVLINKLKHFQDLGHNIFFLIGDFTAMIGDPSGKSKTRPVLTKEQVVENAKTYKEQIFKILDPNKTKVVFNSEWMEKMPVSDFIQLAGQYTVSRMLERNDFKNRFENQEPISIHEFLYPLMQGYDSVALEADVEIGGTDQTFNLGMGRVLQKHYGKNQQVVITMPIIEGLDGVKKMSKSLGNYIAINDNPGTMWQKILSIPDSIMWTYFDLLSFKTKEQISEFKSRIEKGENPQNIKKILAEELIERFHDKNAVKNAANSSGNIVELGTIPEHIDTIEISIEPNEIPVVSIIRMSGMTKNSSAAKDVLKRGAVFIDGQQITDPIMLQKGKSYVVQAGKKHIKKINIK